MRARAKVLLERRPIGDGSDHAKRDSLEGAVVLAAEQRAKDARNHARVVLEHPAAPRTEDEGAVAVASSDTDSTRLSVAFLKGLSVGDFMKKYVYQN